MWGERRQRGGGREISETRPHACVPSQSTAVAQADHRVLSWRGHVLHARPACPDEDPPSLRDDAAHDAARRQTHASMQCRRLVAARSHCRRCHGHDASMITSRRMPALHVRRVVGRANSGWVGCGPEREWCLGWIDLGGGEGPAGPETETRLPVVMWPSRLGSPGLRPRADGLRGRPRRRTCWPECQSSRHEVSPCPAQRGSLSGPAARLARQRRCK